MNIRIDDLKKSFGGEFSLDVASLRIPHGQTIGLVGNNGAGKTTFLRLLLDLLPPDGGSIHLGDHEVGKTTAWKRHTGAFLDTSFLIDFLTPDEYLAFVGSTYGLEGDEIERNLEPYRDFFTDPVLNQSTRRIRDLSTGNAKKIGIVGALIVKPDLVLLDEPFANLDPRSQLKLRELLRQENEQDERTMLVSSHDLVHVTEVCERITVMEDGHIVKDEKTTPETRESLENFFTDERALLRKRRAQGG